MGTGQLPLEGIRVVEAATFLFGPAAGTVMSDFGADVVHIEHPFIGDMYRYLHMVKPLPECAQDYCWLLTSRNKKSIAVDLKSEEGREVVYRLIKDADVFITNYHPSVVEKLGLQYERLEAMNPRLIYAHATGYGEVGDEVERPGFDATAWWARSGLMDAVHAGDAGMGLAVPAMGDHPSAMALLSGILLALYARERTGLGTKVSSSLMANGAWTNGILVQAALCGAAMPDPPIRSQPTNALVNHYRTADGRYVYLVTIQEMNDWERICDALGRPDLPKDPRFAELDVRRENAVALTAILDGVFAQKPLDAWREILDRNAITYGVIARTDELPQDQQMQANGVFREISGMPDGPLRTVDSPIYMRGVEKVPPRRAPDVGEHSVEVLQSLGYSAEEIEQLCNSGTVRAM